MGRAALSPASHREEMLLTQRAVPQPWLRTSEPKGKEQPRNPRAAGPPLLPAHLCSRTQSADFPLMELGAEFTMQFSHLTLLQWEPRASGNFYLRRKKKRQHTDVSTPSTEVPAPKTPKLNWLPPRLGSI